MNLTEFISIWSENIILYITCFLLNVMFFWKIAARYTHSWIDPLRIAILFAVFANTIPIFLFFLGYIDSFDFLHFLLFEFCFWMGFLLFSKREINFKNTIIKNENKLSYALFILFFIGYILITGYTYMTLGIPLFLDSRLSLFVNTGLGTIERLSPFFLIYCLVYSFYLIDNFKNSLFHRGTAYLVFFVFILTSILSGGKGSILTIVYSCFGYYYFYKKNILINKKYIKYFLLTPIAAFLVIMYSQTTTLNSAIIQLFIRFIASGDIYWIAYPQHLYANVNINTGNSFTYLFSGILAPLRIINAPNFADAMGFQFTRLLFPELYVLVGPNVRLPVLSQILFGWGGVFLCFFAGCFLSLCIFRLPSLLPKGIISIGFYTYFYITIIAFFTDFTLGIGYLINIAFCFTFLMFTAVLFASMLNSYKIK